MVCSISKVREVVEAELSLVEKGFEFVHNGVWIGFVFELLGRSLPI